MPLPKELRSEIEKGTPLLHVQSDKHPYLVAAEAAIDHVRSSCGILAANRDADQALWKSTKPTVDMEQTHERAQDDIELNTPKKFQKTLFGTDEIVDPADKVRAEAEYTEKYGVGNCEPQASVAFEYLKKMGIKPLDIVFYAPFDKFAKMPVKPLGKIDPEMVQPDHVFVVIGRPKQSDVTTYTTWGKDAVVCDAWARKAYFASQLANESEMLGTISAGQIKLMLRLRWE
jgi:hypothetical protein